MATITLNGFTIDTAAPKPALASLALDNATADASDYVLVQTRHPLDRAEREALAQAGASILEAVPDSALVCHFPGTDLGAVRALPFVEWADLYPKLAKLPPSMRQLQPRPGGIPISAAALAPMPTLDPTPVTIDAELHDNAEPAAAKAEIARAAHLPESDLAIAGRKIRLTCKRRRLEDVAAVDAVRAVREVLPPKLANDVARQILRAPAIVPGDPGSWDGHGEVVAIADTGFDQGSTSNPHPAFEGRVRALYPLGRAGRADDPDGHGTHVAGSAVGDASSATLNTRISGTAPAASLVLQSLLDDSNGLFVPADLNELFLVPYRDDAARIHSNSWGTPGAAGEYDTLAREVDEFVYAHRDMLICFAAGNEGRDLNADGVIDAGSVIPPGTAKNCLTVGACENERPSFPLTYRDGWPNKYTASPIASDLVADNPEGMAAFSSRGPTNDHRIKPDVVAPGTYILSTRSRATKSEGWLLSEDPLYMYEGGTSMATPLVAGCCAAVRGFLRARHNVAKPSAALLKALLINGAHDIAGQYTPSEASAIPNNSEGFGRVDLGAIVAPEQRNETLQFFDEGRKLDTGEQEDRVITIGQAGARLKVTLVWTDPPGESLQNDLDLIVRVGNEERHGNMAPGATQFDTTNNVEQVLWTGLPLGSATVTVRARSIARLAQDYALAIRIG